MTQVGRVSVHFVPDQTAEDIVKSLRSHLERVFVERGSSNELSIVVKQVNPKP
jgi:hypothetical protein